MPRNCSKNASLSGIGLVAALRSMFADLTPSASGESEVSKHYSPTNHQPKNKVKTKSQSQNHARVQKQQKVRVKQRCGAGAAKERGLNQSVAKTTAERNRLTQRGQRRDYEPPQWPSLNAVQAVCRLGSLESDCGQIHAFADRLWLRMQRTLPPWTRCSPVASRP
jgi:hypothetical protein